VHISELFSIAGKTAVVTGGSRGIGEMIAAGFLANGAKVYITSRKADACDATAARLTARWGGECIAIPADLSGPDGADTLAARISEREERVDIVVNNAGQAWGAPFAEFPEKGWDRVMNVNVKGPFFVIQRLMPLLEAAATAEDPARVINIGSIDGLRPPRLQTYSYSPSKAALHAMTR
jgi:2-deoxy-D-gluconate 3-dehydrogenase